MSFIFLTSSIVRQSDNCSEKSHIFKNLYNKIPKCNTNPKFYCRMAQQWKSLNSDNTSLNSSNYYRRSLVLWQGSCTSKAHKPITLSGNPTFTKVYWHLGEGFKVKKNSASNLRKKKWGRFLFFIFFKLGFRPRNFSVEKKSFHANLKNVN